VTHRYVLLGAGRQGLAAAYDLGRFGAAREIVLTDIDADAAASGAARLNRLLGRQVATARLLDIADIAAVEDVLEGAAACISSVHYTFNVAITKLVIAARAHMTDLGGRTDIVREQIGLDADARRAGISVVPDCGMGPGLNISLATYAMSLVENPREVRIWDGGLPQDRQPPWNYASTFALAGLINEFDGWATFLREGQLTEVPCLSDVEDVEFPAPIGRLEAFVTSGGLSTSPWTFQGILSRLENKTLRYPGHVAKLQAFADLGLFEQRPIRVGHLDVVPRDVFQALLAPRIQRAEVRDVCVMRATCSGDTGGQPAEATVELIDRYDQETGFTAMQRLTGWHASIMLIAAVDGRIPRGVVPVEKALPGKAVVEDARRRGFAITERVTVT
jgi:lysine 6-dehydrogenase